MDVPKTAGIPNAHVEEVDPGVFEVVLESELDAKGIVEYLKQISTINLLACRYEPDDDNVRWLVHVETYAGADWDEGFVVGLMAGWQRASEGD